MRRIFKILKYLSIGIVVLIALLFGAGSYLYLSSDRSLPAEINIGTDNPISDLHGVIHYKGSSLSKGEGELWNLRLVGGAAERGIAFGKLCKDLLYEQERAFVDQIKKIIPNERYLIFLKYLTSIYNRDIRNNIGEEFKTEIYATSLSCSDEFNSIGPAYDRQLNYHAAHDLGHAMQDYMLVGCTSFAVKNSLTVDSSLIIARNFDFWVGDDFAKNKLITIMEPNMGYRFISIGWAGMCGVLSGMNEKGLTITLNAAKSRPPVRSKTPISIIAREILQYASTIEEAYSIARKRDAFVSESLLIGSGIEGRAAIIEKRPDSTILYTTGCDMTISTNHFQSDQFLSDPNNRDAIDAIEGSHSLYRYLRVEELIEELAPLDQERCAQILREPNGLGGKSLGLGNEMSVNQYISHHAVIFKPQARVMWVSSSDWQLGRMVKYDLNEIFGLDGDRAKREYGDIAADSSQILTVVAQIHKFRSMTRDLLELTKRRELASDSFRDDYIESNPCFYETYLNLADNYLRSGDRENALILYTKSAEYAIPSLNIKEELDSKIKKLSK